jgi:hypothetical protein
VLIASPVALATAAIPLRPIVSARVPIDLFTRAPLTRGYAGTTGQVQYSRSRRSCTWYEIIADVDANINAENVVPRQHQLQRGVPGAQPDLRWHPLPRQLRMHDRARRAGRRPRARPVRGRRRLRRLRVPRSARRPVAGRPVAGRQVYRATNPGGTVFGVRAPADRVNRWVNTRPVWNLHAYSVTNINDDGTVPRRPTSPSTTRR